MGCRKSEQFVATKSDEKYSKISPQLSEKAEPSSAQLETLPEKTKGLDKLCDIKHRLLTAIASFRDEFRSVVHELQGEGGGEENPELAAEFNALLGLLGFDLYVGDRKNKNRTHHSHLRWKDVPGVRGGQLEARAQIDGEQRVLSSRQTLPDRMVLKEKSSTRLSSA